MMNKDEIYKLKNIRLEGNEHGYLAPDVIYADLYDSKNELTMAATLETILKKIRNQNWAVEGISVIKYVSRNTICSKITLDWYK